MNPMMNPAMGNPFVEDFSNKMPLQYAGRLPPQVFDPLPFMPNEVVVGERIEEPTTRGFQYAGMEWASAVKPYVTMDKFVEVPQTIIKEGVRHVPKPEIVERIIEVPKMSYNERTVTAPKKYEEVERIVEVPARPIVEHRPPQHIPKVEIQERLIEIPKIEYRERIEYEDRIEYREVPVDKIVEVPQIEYVQREVERYIPQVYVKEVDKPRYVTVGVGDIQENMRVEHVPVINPIPRYHPMPVPVNIPVQSPSPMMGNPMPMSGNWNGSANMMPMTNPGMMPRSGFGPSPFGGPMGSMPNAYANYDPMRAGMGSSFRGPPGSMPPTMGSFRGPPTMGSFRGPPTMGGPMGSMPPMPMGSMAGMGPMGMGGSFRGPPGPMGTMGPMMGSMNRPIPAF
jgi:hypothetical protein